MDASLSSKIMKESMDVGGSSDGILEYLIKLQTEKFKRQQAAGSLDFKALQAQLRELELDISMLNPLKVDTSSTTTATAPLKPVNPFKTSPEMKVRTSSEPPMVYNTLPVSRNDSMVESDAKVIFDGRIKTEPISTVRSSFDDSQTRSQRNSSVSVTTADLLQVSPLVSHARTSSTATRHSSVHLPLYTVPNAFNYNIKLRDTNTTGVSSTSDSSSVDHFVPASIQGSKERRSDIRSITDKLSDFGNESFSQSITTVRHSEMILAAVKEEYDQEDFPSPIDDILATQSGESVQSAEITSMPGNNLVSIEEDYSSILEFCIVEADFNALVKDDLKFISPLLPPKEIWRYPLSTGGDNNNTQLIQTQNFFFPSGVPVDFVAPSVVSLYTKKCNYKRHIVPFMDVKGVPNYACCLTVTQAYSSEEIRRINDKIIINLIKINQMKHAVHTIQKIFRQFVINQKLRNWNVANRNSTHLSIPNNRQSSIATPSFIGSNQKRASTDLTSTLNVSSNASVASVAPQKQPGLFSRLFLRRSSSELDASQHTHTYTVSTTSTTATLSSSAPPGAAETSPVTKNSSSTTTSATQSGRSVSNVSASPENNSSPRKSVASEGAVDSAVRQVMTENINNKLAASAAGGINITKSTKDIILTLVTYHALSPLDINEIVSHIIDKISNTVPSDTVYASASSTEMLTTNATPQQIKERILHLIGLSSLSPDDLNEILHSITNKSHTNSLDVSSESVEGALARESISIVESSYSAVDMETALYESLHVALAARYSNNRVVVAQKAYCIITAASEYTFIFKVLDAIAEAETNKEQGRSGSKPSSPLSSLAAVFNQKPTVEANRLQFLDQIQAYMADNFFNSKANNYQLQDLSLNFTLPKQKYNTVNALNGTNSNNGNQRHCESVNKLLSKYAHLAQAEAKAAGVAGASSWTTPAQQISNPHGKTLRPNNNKTTVASDDSQGSTNDDFDAPFIRDTSGNQQEETEMCLISVPNYIDYFLIDKRSLLTTKEWSCAVLFAHLNASIVFKIINLLLMEKSLIIYGKNPGIVTSITLAVINLISPFVWEGIFVPLVPDNARELFGAPVPLILGTISPPRIADVSTSTAILYLNDDIIIHNPVIKKHVTKRTSLSKYSNNSNNNVSDTNIIPPAETTIHQSEFLAWFVRLPEVTADMPVDEEISRRIEHTRILLCNHYIKQMEFTHRGNQKSSIYSDKPMVARSSVGKNVMDYLLMSNVPSDILKQIQILITAIKRNNFNFCGNVIKDPASWKKFLKYSATTGEEEFYPEQFMEPLRNYLEFQEAMATTQLFVAFMDKLKKEQQVLDHVRKFIGHWIYFRVVLWRKNKQNNRRKYSGYDTQITSPRNVDRRNIRPLEVKLDDSTRQFVAYNTTLLQNLKTFN